VTPDEIRATEIKLAGDPPPEALLQRAQINVLREIAAQLAELNALHAEANARAKQEIADVQEFRKNSLASQDQIKSLMQPPPQPPVGTIISAPDGRYGIVMEGGYVRPIPEEEALRLIAEAEQAEKERKPS
jgi:hypothetical protein